MLLVAGLVVAGEWTTYADVAAGAGHPGCARQVGRLASVHPDFPDAHRVLGSGGRVVRPTPAGTARARRRLEREGVGFDGARADPGRRVTWVTLRGRLAELTEPADAPA